MEIEDLDVNCNPFWNLYHLFWKPFGILPKQTYLLQHPSAMC